MTTLDAQGCRLLAWLVGKLKGVVPGRPETYVSYKDAHDELNLQVLGPTYGESLKHQGLSSLADWTEAEGKPGITGIIIDRSTSMPGDGYFKLFGKITDDFGWWADQVQQSKQFDWSSYLPGAQPSSVARALPESRRTLAPQHPHDVEEAILQDQAGSVVPLAEELPSSSSLVEGAACQVTINAYERNPIARRCCIDHYGPTCVACGFNFSAVYGPLAEGFIHVHHVTPLSEIGEEYEVDPVADLRPVCPNCHAVIHLGGKCRSIEEVRQLLRRYGGERN